jgi:hypothetical protein
MRGRTVRRVVALLSTIACCIALPASVRAATDDSTTPAKSSKSTAKPSTSSKSSSKPASKSSKPSSKSSTKSSSKSSSAKANKSSGKTSSSKKSSKATASTKKAAPAPVATKPAGASDAVRAAFDPAAPSTGIPGAPAATASATPPGQRGPTRIDFDDRLIQGQRNTAGAVYLYDRKELKQRSMIKKRESFREEIVGVVYDSEL